MVGSVNGNSAVAAVVGNGDSKNEDITSVRVALRIRPPLPRELINGCQICTSVTPGISQVWIGGQHAFTYDYVFDTNSKQEVVFEDIRGLIDGCLDGFNATILAYGQTGSGKTYTMGTGFDIEENIDSGNSLISNTQGIVPRAVYYLFDCIDRRLNVDGVLKPTFKISIQFIELYNEEVIDLVDGQQSSKTKRIQGGPPSSANPVKIHEDVNGGIYLVGVGTQSVHTAAETMKCLRLGALGRTTASTNMNDQSSRSHAIFTILIEQTKVVISDEGSAPDFETLTAKFHFVDLAGSERLKRTGAVGDRQKEGISINCGLLSLGNVISALGDKSKKSSHVPYRDSKLTRLLQDSLGGNSRTIMIACVSPCDIDFVETLNTLKYANRARNIKNKVTVNQDKSSRMISDLKERIRELEDELLEYKNGRRAIDPITGEETETDAYIETKLLQFDLNRYKTRVEALQGTVDTLTAKNSQLIADKTLLTFNGQVGPEMIDLVHKYTQDIEELRAQLVESDSEKEALRKRLESNAKFSSFNQSPRTHVAGSRSSTAMNPQSNISNPESSVTDLLDSAKREIESEQDVLKKLKRSTTANKAGTTSLKTELKKDKSSDDEEDEEAAEEEDDDTGTTDETDENENENYTQLATISNDITTKQKLIDQLEASQRRMEIVKKNYEEKLNCLVKKISATEEERDKVLFSSQPTPKMNQVKADYEKKLSELQSELKKWQLSAKDHQKLLKNNSETTKQIEQLKNDCDKMKQIKVKLMQQIKVDSVKFRNLQSARSKELAQHNKEQRKKDNAIRILKTETQTKEGILKRKHEEINYLKNKMRSTAVSAKTNGKQFSPVKAKQKWTSLQSNLIQSMKQKQNLESYESEMTQVIENRKQLNLELEDRRQALRTASTTDEKNKIMDEMDSISKSITYAEERLSALQGELLSNNVAEHEVVFEKLVNKLNKEECCYIMKKMYEYCSENLGSNGINERRVGLLEQENQKISGQFGIVTDLYRHLYFLYTDRNTEESRRNTNGGDNLPPSPDSLGYYASSGLQSNQNSAEPRPSSTAQPTPTTGGLSNTEQRSRKARRLTSTPAQFLGISASQTDFAFIAPAPVMAKSATTNPAFVNPNDVTFKMRRADPRTQSMRLPKSTTTTTAVSYPTNFQKDKRRDTYVVTDEDRLKLQQQQPLLNGEATSVNGNNRNVDATHKYTQAAWPDELEDEMDFQNTTFINSPTNSPEASPIPIHKPLPTAVTNNVFQRLTSQAAVDENISSGIIKPVRPTSRGIVFNTHIAEGHSKAVLSLYATQSRLYSGGKDSTIKIWDLNTRTEVQTLSGNAGSVTAVRCSTDENLVFTASLYFIKIWDRRLGGRCVKTLSSSGSVVEDVPFEATANKVPNGEHQIQALAVTNSTMYSTFGNHVRAWDVRNFTNLGLLKGNHQSNVMCMATEQSKVSKGTSTLVTGSKDHSMKVYELGSNETIASTPVKLNLDPPHYDGIQSLVISNGILYSGSRDACIKKWDLNRNDGKCSVQRISKAHSDWITGLAFAPRSDKHLLSVSRDGFMKLWSIDSNFNELESYDVNKGKAVECITANETFIFTGSNDGTVGFWRSRPEYFASSPEARQQSQIEED